MSAAISISGRFIGKGYPVYLIAELSANHNQDFEEAVRIVEAAKEAGADAVRLQTYTPDTITIASDREYFRIGGGTLRDGRNLYSLYREAYTPWEWQPKLKQVANDLGLDLFSSAFDDTAVDFLEEMGVPVHKLASFELVDIQLIQKMAGTGKPLIMSTGMASFATKGKGRNCISSTSVLRAALLIAHPLSGSAPGPAMRLGQLSVDPSSWDWRRALPCIPGRYPRSSLKSAGKGATWTAG